MRLSAVPCRAILCGASVQALTLIYVFPSYFYSIQKLGFQRTCRLLTHFHSIPWPCDVHNEVLDFVYVFGTSLLLSIET